MMRARQWAGVPVATLVWLAWATSAGAQQLRIGYINSERVVAEAPAFAGVRETLEREVTPLREELRQLEAELQAADEALRAATLTEAARAERQQALQQQFARYQTRVQQIQQQVNAREQQLMEPIMTRMRAVLEEIRREGNYSFIIDPPEGLILAVDPALDVTTELIRRLGAAPPQQ